MRTEREQKLRDVAAKRQLDLVVVLDNIHDAHNIGAILRSCDAVGVQEVYVLYTDPKLRNSHIELGKRTSAGARKWVDVYLFRELGPCFDQVRQKCAAIYGAHLDPGTQSLYQLELTQPVALVFGNEDQGLSQEVLSQTDGNFIIPQVGMVESLNVSVACAITLYEAFRQRTQAGCYATTDVFEEAPRQALWESFNLRHTEQLSGRTIK